MHKDSSDCKSIEKQCGKKTYTLRSIKIHFNQILLLRFDDLLLNTIKSIIKKIYLENFQLSFELLI